MSPPITLNLYSIGVEVPVWNVGRNRLVPVNLSSLTSKYFKKNSDQLSLQVEEIPKYPCSSCSKTRTIVKTTFPSMLIGQPCGCSTTSYCPMNASNLMLLKVPLLPAPLTILSFLNKLTAPRPSSHSLSVYTPITPPSASSFCALVLNSLSTAVSASALSPSSIILCAQ